MNNNNKQYKLFEEAKTEPQQPISEKKHWEVYRKDYPELLPVSMLCQLVVRRIGCSARQFHAVYRSQFPMAYYGIYRRGNKKLLAEKKIRFDEANRIIDNIIENPVQYEDEK